MMLRTRRDDEGTALLLVIMAILVAASLSVLVLGMLVAQASPTIQQRKYTRTIHSAEGGLNAALSQLRASVSNNAQGVSQGDRSKLPCGPITGTIGGEDGNVAYSVTVAYFTSDPTQQNSTWRSANALPCVAGYGPSQTPTFALLTAVGSGDSMAGMSAASGNRTLESVYNFQITNANVSGGRIHNFYGGQSGNLDLCFDAGSDNPANNATVTVTVCDTHKTSQLFAYLTNYELVLTPSQTAANPAGMCVTYDSTSATLVMRTCANTGNATVTQKWGFDDVAHFRDPYPTNDVCIEAQTDNTSGSVLVANNGTCNQGSYSRQWAWAPEAKVGAGNAGPAQSQLVNYLEFGRCFDVTGQDVNATYIIDWPCKQDPTAAPAWNQQQAYNSANGQLVVKTTYCVTAPAATEGYVTLKTCVAGQANQKWTESGDTSDYASSYTVLDYQGRCLALGPPANIGSDWSTIVVSPCDGGLDQKWNAPPNLVDAANKNTREKTGS